MTIIDDLTAETRDFAIARDWLQFHTPKNLAMAIAGEAGELAAEFQWLTAEEAVNGMLSKDQFAAIRLEMADVLIYLLRLGDVLQVDLAEAVREKLLINEGRFPRARPTIE